MGETLGRLPAAGATSLKVTGYADDSITLLANAGATYTFNLDANSSG
jgi:hypothetical protein